MKFQEYTIRAYGTSAVLIQYTYEPAPELFRHLYEVKEILQSRFQAEVILTYTELLIKNLVPTKDSIQEVKNCLRTTYPGATLLQSQRLIKIPVCYDTIFGSDLEALAKAKKMTKQELISLHTEPEYLVYFLGFLPGFPYLLGLNPLLHTPRKAVPSRQIEAGSVALGGQQAGIYPQDSPGGWQVIGHCPIPLFDAALPKSSLFLSGDCIKFVSISKQEHTRLSGRSLEEFRKSSYCAHG